ncbi:MAG: hypothetical protein AB7I04_13980 [Pseudomonadales bacterium]
MQEMNSASGAATVRMAGGTGDEQDGSTVEALRNELAKWQARVPKLASALKERTSEVESLKARLAEREQHPGSGGAAQSAPAGSGIQARDALIRELEAKVKALSGKYQDTEGQLRARDLEISQLRQETEEWREKWQAATGTLDAQADGVEQKERELKRLQKELDELLSLQESHKGRIKEQDLELTSLRERSRSLESRNQNLFETTELANRQIETLGENLEHLRAELKAAREALAAQEARSSGGAREIDMLKGQIASRDQDIEFLHAHVEEKQVELTRLTERLAELEPLKAAAEAAEADRDALTRALEEREAEVVSLSERLAEQNASRQALEAAQEAAQAEKASFDATLTAAREAAETAQARLRDREEAHAVLREEIARLEACVAAADEATSRFEAERRQLSEQQEELKRRNQHLESQLSERSSLVVGLEQEKSAISSRTSSLEAENRRLSEALEKAQKAAAGNADHIAQVDARLERQKQLMENLEAEFAEVQEEYADAVKTHQRVVKDKDAEIATLRERADDASVAALRKALADTESLLEETRNSASVSREQIQVEAEKSRKLAAQLDALRAEDENVRRSLNEKVERLERQLHKQSKATADAEAAAEAAKAALQDAEARGSRVPEEVSGENAQLQAEVIKLEGMVRERTEQLNKLRWQQDMLEKQRGSDPTDGRMMMVLNQQLQTAREENGKLRETIRGLEAERQSARQTALRRPPAADDSDRDDLARIKGVGPKLVRQLKKLGITRFDQIATLSEADLDDPQHPLHAMKGRVIKDDWISQAARLSGVI